MSEEHFRKIIEGVGISIWEEDFSHVKMLVDALAAEGVRDFRRYFVEHPDVVERAIGLVRILDVNPASVRMFGATSRGELLQSLHQIFLPETRQVFFEELVSIAEHQQFFESETVLKTLRGDRLHALLTITFPPPDQSFDRIVVTLTDITKRKRAEEALRESEERYRSLTAAITSLVWTTDAKGRFVTPQPGWTAYTGQAWEQLREYGWNEATHPDDRETIQRVWNAACISETSFEFSGRLWHASSHAYRHVETRGVPIRNADGTVREWIGKCLDVEDRTQAEKALQESEHRFSKFMRHLPGLAWIKDLQGHYVYANETAELVFQTPRERLYGRTDKEIFPQDVADQFKENDRQALISETGVQVVETLKHQDGVLHHAIVSKFPILGADGRPVLIGGMAIDITARKQAEQLLLESESEARRLLALNQTIMMNMGEGLYTLDSQGLVTYVNPEAERLLGWTSGELLGRSMHQMAHYQYPDGSPFPIEECAGFQVLRNGKVLRDFEDTFIRKDGSYFPVSYSSSPLRDQNGKIAGIVIVFQDISERKQAEENLRRWKDELEVRVQTRTGELLSSKNRLRSLAAQLSLTEEHQRRKLARDLHDYLVQLLVVGRMKLHELKENVSLPPEAEVLTGEVEDVLQQALTYSRTTIAELSPPALHETGLAESLKWLAEIMEKHGLRVKVHTSDYEAIPLSEDRVILLFQSLRELLFNVLKHAGVDEATVRMSSGQVGKVCIAVEDHGKGLQVGAMQQAMEPGHLGLFAVQERMEAMGGRVEFTSAPGKGTSVRLVLPIHGSPGEIDTESPRERKITQSPGSEHTAVNPQCEEVASIGQTTVQPRIRVMLVDDHVMFRKGMQKLLERYPDVEIVGEANDGEEAVRVVPQLMPDVVVMDNNMPKLNGIDATRRICREWPAIKVIGLSMYDEKEIRAAMLDAGAVDYLQKNGTVTELYQAICALFPQPT
ncbi:PAS domain S-box protein [Candidatus Nitrospira neomarina]|uniref:histidine kinase n=1 Tax=Candidatus Nitrospira neomarina TaxID=3020899 RepID=A0AA96K378_9BACT|nr:PAS domain S-box protein [Candidatus Nitrospira neomarina]WNM62324.1 PAS domain S-box protein [Candidatus Nitrospira neomarina]